jgi:hypothetical protein
VSETRKLGFDPDDRFFMNEGRVGSKVIHNPTDAERVELAIAALTHGTSRWLPDVLAPENTTVEYQTRVVLIALADLRAALARDAAAKESEQDADRDQIALAADIISERVEARISGKDVDLVALARRVAQLSRLVSKLAGGSQVDS